MPTFCRFKNTFLKVFLRYNVNIMCDNYSEKLSKDTSVRSHAYNTDTFYPDEKHEMENVKIIPKFNLHKKEKYECFSNNVSLLYIFVLDY